MPPDDDGRTAGGKGGDYDAAENLAHWLKQVRAAGTDAELVEVRAQANADFARAQDMPGWEAVRAEVKSLRAAMRAGTQ